MRHFGFTKMSPEGPLGKGPAHLLVGPRWSSLSCPHRHIGSAVEGGGQSMGRGNVFARFPRAQVLPSILEPHLFGQVCAFFHYLFASSTLWGRLH